MSQQGKLQNTFSWSFSRHRDLSDCPKKYWYKYYGSWEGWNRFTGRQGEDLATRLYVLKQLQSLPMFLGSAVHVAIEEAIKGLQKGKPLPSLEKLAKRADHLLMKGIKESETKAWLRSPKRHANLHEIYQQQYWDGDGIDPIKLEEARSKVLQCIENWHKSPVAQGLLASKQTEIMGIEELDSFLLDDLYKIWVVMDLCVRWKQSNNNALCVIFDWKTGKETELTLDQLSSYALFVNQEWKIPLDNVVLTPFYLGTNQYTKIGKGQDEALTSEGLEKTRSFMRSSCEKMVSYLDKGSQISTTCQRNQASPEHFEYTENKWQCGSCPFQEVCEAANYEQLNKEQLSALVKDLPELT